MIKQRFYLIGHNPNTVEEAKEFLLAGANAIEPDIRCDGDKPDLFYVSHGESYNLSLATYLDELRHLITHNKKTKHLALINFDIKDPLPIGTFLKVVHDHFSKHDGCKGVAILVTHGGIEGGEFLLDYDEKMAMVGVGIDEGDSARDVHRFFKKKKKIAYANGIYVAGLASIYRSISEGKFVQATVSPHFKFVSTWTLAAESSLRSFLNLHIDGIIVNLSTVQELRNMLKESHYSRQYMMAPHGHNPWTAKARPTYALSIRTRDEAMAGTDAWITFRLHGTKGSCETRVNSDYLAMMEQGQLNHCTIEGKDLGKIKKLTITTTDDGNGPGWLPQRIVVKSALLQSPITFKYSEDDWIYYDTPNTKTVS